MTYLLLALAIAANIAALVSIARHYRSENRADRTKHAAILAAKDDAIEAIGARADVMERSAEQFAARLLLARRERDTYRTAFEALMRNQTSAELLHPDEPVGTATVIDWPVAEVVDIKRGAK
jgi:hypothetical protein